MNYTKLFIVILTLACGALNCAKKGQLPNTPTTPTEKIVLFNGQDLTGWVFACKDSSITDVSHTWSVKNSLICDTGDPFGYIRTDRPYQNFQFHAEWRWVTEGVPENANRNSGFLFTEDNSNKVWPPFFECQLQSGNAGDFVHVGGATSNELLELRELKIKEAGNDSTKLEKAKRILVVPRKHESSEKSIGEWNTADVTLQNNTAIATINGVEQNRATGISLSSGYICLQSEGAPVEFRNVYIEPIK